MAETCIYLLCEGHIAPVVSLNIATHTHTSERTAECCKTSTRLIRTFLRFIVCVCVRMIPHIDRETGGGVYAKTPFLSVRHPPPPRHRLPLCGERRKFSCRHILSDDTPAESRRSRRIHYTYVYSSGDYYYIQREERATIRCGGGVQ